MLRDSQTFDLSLSALVFAFKILLLEEEHKKMFLLKWQIITETVAIHIF